MDTSMVVLMVSLSVESWVVLMVAMTAVHWVWQKVCCLVGSMASHLVAMRVDLLVN